MASTAPSPTSGEPAGGQAVDETVGQPAAQGTGGKDAPGGSAPGEVAEPEPKKPRQRKERLPGVMTRGDGDDIFPELGVRGKDGRRVSRQEGFRELDAELQEEHGHGLDLPPPPEGSEKKPEEKAPETTQKIKFGDKEYNNLGEIEQSFKSLQGMFKPMQERLTKAEQLAEQTADLARQWHRRAMELEQGTVQPSPAQPKTETPKPADELEQALSRVNGELFESLAREHGLPLAGRYLAAQVLATVHDDMLPRLREEIMAQLKPELEPLKQDRGFQQATQHVAGLMDSMSQYKNADGSDAFPELNDPDTCLEIGTLWRDLNLPAEIALTPQGLLQAIGLYRMYRGANPQAATSTPTVSVSQPQNVAPRAAAASADAGSSLSPMAGRQGAESESVRFARELAETHLVDKDLGFSVRRRR